MSNQETQFPNEKGKLNIFFWVSENSGVGYFRQYVPAMKLREHGLANVMISDFRWGIGDHVEPDLPQLTKIVNWADVIVVGRKDQGEFYAQWGGLKDLYNVPVILDTDDNIFHVRPSNPGYAGYHPGSEAITWNKFGVTKVFDAITVSTDNLVEVYKKYNPKVFLLPNNLDVKWWEQSEKKVHNDGFIRIGMVVSGSHGDGVNIIKDPIVRILRKHKNVKFLISQIYHSWFKDTDVFDRIEPIPWIQLREEIYDEKKDETGKIIEKTLKEVKEWPKEYQSLGIDIGLAPLADNNFNRAKSNLRWMEYSVQGIPAIVSPVEAYKCVKDGFNGLVAYEREDWFNAMDKLITDTELRETVGKNAMHTIKQEYNIDRNIGMWLETYTKIHDSYHDFFGNKKRFVIGNKGLQELGGKRKR